MRSALISLISISIIILSGIIFLPGEEGLIAYEDDKRINQDTGSGTQSSPDMAVDANNIHIVWQDGRNSNNDIYIRSSTNSGVSFSGEVRVDDTGRTPTLTDDKTSQEDPEIAVAPNGTLLAVWSDDRDGRSMIYMAMSVNGGMTFSSNYVVSDHPVGIQTKPHMDVSASGKIFVVWEDTRDSIGHEQIYGAYSTDGRNFGSAERISDTSTSYYCFEPSVSWSGNDKLLVTWTEDRIIDKDIRITSSTDNGDTFSNSFILNRDPSSSDQEMAYIDANSTTVVVVWKDSRSTSADVYMAISNDRGSSFKMEFVTHPSFKSGHQYDPEVHIEYDGNISICWTSSPGKDDPSKSDVQMTRYLVNGTFDEVETVNDRAVGETQDSPSMGVSNGMVHVAWRDQRKIGDSDIYYSRTISSAQEGEAPELLMSRVSPGIGGVGEKFYFYVSYFDEENDAPLGTPLVNLSYRSGNQLFPYPGSPFTMTELMDESFDMNYRNGQNYIFSLIVERELELYHRFEVTAISGNLTRVQTELIRGPVIDWEGPGFELLTPQPSSWQKDNIVSFELKIEDDLSSIDPWTVFYQRFNLATEKWDSWQRKGSIDPVDNHSVIYTVNITLFDGTDNLVRFRAKDLLGNGNDYLGYSESDIYHIWVDPAGPFFEVTSPARGEILEDTDVVVKARIWDLGAGLDTGSINISYSLGGSDNYGEWIPAENIGAEITPDEREEEYYDLEMNLSFTVGFNNFFRLRGMDLLGNERISDGYQIVIRKPEVVIEDRPPQPVATIQPAVSGSVRPHITWTPTYDPDGDLVYYWFRITEIGSGTPVINWTNLGAGATYWDPDETMSLEPSRSYLIEIVPQANGLNGTVSNSTLLISTDANMPPPSPIGMVPKATSDPSPVIRWDVSDDPEGDEVFYFIRIGTFYNGGDILGWTSTFTEPKFRITRILGAGIYHVQLMCSDGKDFSTISHNTLSIGIYSPELESERTSIVIYPPEDLDPNRIETKSESIDLKISNKGFTFDTIRIYVSGEATLRDDIQIYTTDDRMELSPGSSSNTTLTIALNENTKKGFYSLNVTVISLDGISSYTKRLTVRIVDEEDIPGTPGDSNNEDGTDDTQLLLWLFFALLFIILLAMFYGYYRIDRKQREEQVEVIREREGRIRAFKAGTRKELRKRDKEKPELPPTKEND
jgi:hypothetical protein